VPLFRASRSALAARAALAALAATTFACAPADDATDATDVAGAADAIQGGAPDQDHPTAGLLVLPAQGFCGATLIAPNVVATAAHCLKDLPSAFYLGKGVPITVFEPASKALDTMARYEIERAEIFPAFERARAFVEDQALASDYTCDENTIDVALVKLRTSVPGLAPTKTAAAPAVGTSCEVVGFSTYRAPGATYETTHERRAAPRRALESPPFRVLSAALGSRTRRGDSGGGLFCDGKLVGVLSCSSASQDDHAGLEKVRGWIDAQVAAWTR
jgi:hypothetical protein